MPNLLTRPNIEFLPFPYQMEKARMTGVVLSGQALKLQSLIEALNTAAGAARFVLSPSFNDLFLLVFMHCPAVRSTAAGNPWGYIRCNEFAVCIPMRDTQNLSKPCWFVPFIAVDAFLPLIAGREILGLPKVTGNFLMGVLDGPGAAPGLIPAWQTAAAWSMKAEAEVFQLPGSSEQAKWTEIVSLHAAGAQAWIQNGSPASISAFLGSASVSGFLSGQAGTLAQQFLEGGHPGIMLKQIPAADDTAQTVYQKLTSCVIAPSALHGIRFLTGSSQANLHEPAAYPLRGALGATATETALLGFVAEIDLHVPAGTEP